LPTVAMPSNLPAGVSVTVEEFGVYQCPPCGLLHPELKKIAAEYGTRVNIVFRNFPLTMNHKNALPAAQAAEAARLQGHFDEMHDRIYEHQNEWKDLEDPRPIFAKYAKEIGLDQKVYARDVDGLEVQQKIEFDKKTALARGVNGTPTIFIEGNQLKPEVTNLEGLRSGINIMLTRKAGR
jgi:protein-disulfide isomerase